MKRLLFLLTVITSLSQSGLSETWVMHGVKDNYTDFIFWSAHLSDPQYWSRWDWDWDQVFPLQADSGNSVDGYIGATGYSDTLTFTTPPGVFLYEIDISSPYPDYVSGNQWLGSVFDFSTMTPEPLVLFSGAYWVDYDSSGVIRLSTTEPIDFGKWAWDGSVNPNYIGPLSIRGRGHTKHPR